MRLKRLVGRVVPVAALGIAVVGTTFAGVLVATSSAATAVAPKPTGEPAVSGTPQVGEVLRSTRGSWTGTTPIKYAYRWFRCQGRGAPDASDCQRIANAANDTYTLRDADAGFQIRSQVVATNDDGSATATSNATGVVQSAKPANTVPPSIAGTLVVGNRLTANRGQWVGRPAAG